MSRPPGEVFPQTLRTWIGEQLEAAPDRDALHAYLMRVYAPALLVYLKGWRTPPGRGEDELSSVISSFFVSRLSRADFLPAWQRSGRPLRAWLMAGLKFHIQEQRRRDRTDARFGLGGNADHGLDASPPEPEIDGAAIDLEFLQQAVREALAEARRAATSAGLDTHWRLFERYRLENADIRGLVAELTPAEQAAALADLEAGPHAPPVPQDARRESAALEARVRVMIRTAQRHFARCLREVIASDIGDPRRVDEVLEDLIAIASR